MFCANCGKEIEDSWVKCPYCGTVVQNKTTGGQPGAGTQEFSSTGVSMPEKTRTKKPIYKRWWFWVIIAVVAIIVAAGIAAPSGGTSEKDDPAEEIVQKLSQFTTLEKIDGGYQFTDNDGGWAICYTTENVFARFAESRVQDCIAEYIGDEELGYDGTFTYDFDENAARVYLDYEAPEGLLSSINYDFDEEEYHIMSGGDRWTLADEFEEYLNNYGYVPILTADIELYRDDLKNNGLDVSEVESLKYDDVAVYAEKLLKDAPAEVSSAPEEETVETQPEPEPASDEYVFPDSDKKYLTEADLQGISADQLRIGRNEIFARHGAIFESEDLQAHFSACSWYNGTTPVADIDMDSVFNDFEKKNVALIKQFEDGGGSASIPIVYGTYSHKGESGECTADVEIATDSGDATIFIDCLGYGGHGLYYFEGILEDAGNGGYTSYCEDFDVFIDVTFVNGGMDVTIEYDNSDTGMSDLDGHYTLDKALDLSNVG